MTSLEAGPGRAPGAGDEDRRGEGERGRTGRGGLVLGVLAGALLAAWAGVRFGTIPVEGVDFRAILAGGGDPSLRYIILELRAPRVVLGFLVGGGLALAGAVFQALLRNPLAEPYILGISGGAAAGAVLILALGLAGAASWYLPGAAFGGALLAIVLVFGVAASAHRRLDVRVLLLSGVVVGAFFAAVIALILALSDAPTVRGAIVWMMGSLSGATWRVVGIVAFYTLPAGFLLLALARPLNLLSLGEETASYLGTRVEGTKRLAYAVASLVAAAGVAFVGVIGFVGLVVPHAVRLLAGPDHRVLLPLSVVAGGTFLVVADLLARTAFAPTEIPIGVITAFVGVPFFLILLRRSVRG